MVLPVDLGLGIRLQTFTGETYSMIRFNLPPLTDYKCADAHGVALLDSNEDGFCYRRGDCFWIYTGADTTEHRTSVPVINLRTFERGIIEIHHVCWFPKIRGPYQSLWTLGGETRKLKLDGSRRFSCWSWVICQRLDGSHPTSQQVEIPTRDLNMEDRTLLSLRDSSILFLRRYRSIIGELPTDSRTVQLDRDKIFGNQKPAYASLTPPSSPGADTIEASDLTNHASVGVQPLVLSEKEMNPWELAADVGNAILRAPTLLERCSRISSVSTHSVNYGQQEINTIISGQRHNKLSGDICPMLNARYLTLSSIEGYAQRPMEIFRDDSCQHQAAIVESDQLHYNHEPAFAATNRRIMKQPTVLSTLWNRDQRRKSPQSSAREHAFNARLCDRKDPDCTYSSQFTCQHFHSPPAKCILHSSSSGIAHEHCVSRRYALPDRFGDCILANIPSRMHMHICCQWKELDRGDWPLLRQRCYGMEKSGERRQKRRVHDKRTAVERCCEEWIGATIMEDELSEEGKRLNEELKNEC